MDALDWARWQFGITTVYHFLFVPLTLGLSLFVAVLQTRWQRTGQDRYLRLTRLFGRILVINFALGVATGLVQEFQFGMNWSSYSRFVGDVFGSLLAVEGLLAFFLESTFLGLWVFGWGRLPPRLHLATIWLVAAGTTASAYFILAANSFMQHPVGYRLNAATGRAELTDFGALITNQALLGAFPHVISSAWLTTSCLVLAVCVWHLWRAKDDPAAYDQSDVDTYLTGARLAAWVAVLVGLVSFISGDFQAKLMTEQQPMKMAAAEGLYETSQPASLSVVTIGSLDGSEELYSVRVPGLLSFLATGSWSGRVEGIDAVRASQEATYAGTPGLATYSSMGYQPIVPVTYWSFRAMIAAGVISAGVALFLLPNLQPGRPRIGRGWMRIAAVTPLLPLVANTCGWVFTEMGRQPWAVFGVMTLDNAVSPGVSAGEVLASMIGFGLVYLVLAVVEVRLVLAAARAGAPRLAPDPDPGAGLGGWVPAY